MNIRLKPLHEQVIVITGASSGIGLATARIAAERGARVVLAARNEADLARAVGDIRSNGGRAVYAVADVADPGEVQAIADAALAEFGRIDSWVNNAGVAMYGRTMDVALDDMRRLFDVVYWGTVHGSRAAVTHMRGGGGALINVASALADRTVPLQGNYSAAKHAVKAFTDALRMELEEEGASIAVTLVKPSSVNTPFFEKARTYMGVEPRPLPPVYAPELVARTILHCAANPTRDIGVGAMARLASIADNVPRVADAYMERTAFQAQRSGTPTGSRPDNLHEPMAHDGGERGRAWEGRTRGTSLYTSAMLRPEVTATVAAVGVGALAATMFGRRHGRHTIEGGEER